MAKQLVTVYTLQNGHPLLVSEFVAVGDLNVVNEGVVVIPIGGKDYVLLSTANFYSIEVTEIESDE